MHARKVLVAVDGSPRAPEVVAAAVDLARATGGMLWLYRAVGLPHELPALALSASPSDLAPMLLGAARESLVVLARSVPPELMGDILVSLAIPWQGVCDAARTLSADLIVIGSHGYAGLDRLLGTTAAKIVNHADRPVLVIK
jgi:nucleotide-binding universal stress UspA family protein